MQPDLTKTVINRTFIYRTFMQRTLFEKIWEFHRVAQRVDGRDLIYIDRHVLQSCMRTTPSRSCKSKAAQCAGLI